MSEQPIQDTTTDFKPVEGPVRDSVPYLAPDLPLYFVPRAELETVKRLLLSRPAASLAPITLHGPAGSGKTSLAAALAHDADILERFPDGVLWASLRGEGSIQHAQMLWGRALGDDLAGVPDTASRSATLRTLLRDRRALLVLDDVTSVEEIRALNVGGPNCARFITTGAGDEVLFAFKTRRFAVSKLSEDEALKLLTAWAGMLPSLYLPTVKEIIVRLSNSALALALVGAQARQGMTWLRLLELLEEEQGPLAALDPNDEEARTRALGLLINLVLSRFGSVQLQRATLLAGFEPGEGNPFSAEAAAACWGLPLDEAEEALQTLIDAAMVRPMPGGMYMLHEALREPLRRRAEPGAIEQAEGRVQRSYLSFVESTPADSPAIDAQLGQILAAYNALRENEPTSAGLFADALMRIYEARGMWEDLAALAGAVVDEARERGDVFREYAVLTDLGYAQAARGQLDEARRAYTRSLTISRNLGDPAGEAMALNNIGAICERQGELDAALGYYREALALRENLGAHEDVAETLLNVAGVLYWQERWDEAANAFQRALDMYTVLGNRRGQASTLLNIGATYERMGRDGEAEQSYQRALAVYANLDDAAGQAQAHNNLGIIALNRGDTDSALAHFKRSLALKEALGDRYGQASTLNNIALLYERQGNRSLALEHFEQSYRLLAALGDSRAEVVRQNIDALRAQAG